MERQILRLPQVTEKVGLSRSSIYKNIKLGAFPKQHRIVGRATGWLESEIDEWILQQAGKLPMVDEPEQREAVRQVANPSPLAELLKAPLGTELLRADEIASITGHKTERDQANWLTDNRWQFHTNGKGEVIVGRMYARIRMCGVNLEDLSK